MGAFTRKMPIGRMPPLQPSLGLNRAGRQFKLFDPSIKAGRCMHSPLILAPMRHGCLVHDQGNPVTRSATSKGRGRAGIRWLSIAGGGMHHVQEIARAG
jgi:hypothetical protein